jgi:hypothetical protein
VPKPVDFASTIDIVDASIAEAAARGDGVGLFELGHKLQAASVDPPPSTRREIERARIELERDLWVVAIGGLLLPPVKDAFVAALHDGVEGKRVADDHGQRAWDHHHHHHHPDVATDDPWVELDPLALEARDRAVEIRLLGAQKAAIEACRGYGRTRKMSYLRDAVREIDAAVGFRRNRLSSGLTPGACVREADRLGRALLAALPPRSLRFLVVLVRNRIAIEFEERLLLGPDGDGMETQLLSKREWTDHLDPSLGSEVPCFADRFQKLFEDDLEKERLKEEAEERRRRDDLERYLTTQRWGDEQTRLARNEAEEDGSVELLDAETNVSSAESTETPDVEIGRRSADEPLKRVGEGLQDERGVTVDVEHGRFAPPGTVTEAMHPAMAAAVNEELKRLARFDADRAQREIDRQEYLDQLRSRAWI